MTSTVIAALFGAWLAGEEPVGAQASAAPVAAAAAAREQDPAADARVLQGAIAGVAARAYEYVVTIVAHERVGRDVPAAAPATRAAAWVRELTHEPPAGFRPYRACSGFILSEAGELLTCRSLLLKDDGTLPDLVTAETKDGAITLCDLVAGEPTLDLALLRFAVFPQGAPPSFGVGRFADSKEVRPGHLVFAIGDPEGPEAYFASGVISSLPNRDCYQEQLTATYLQATMVLHPEAYGGPLVDLDGEIVGMMVPRAKRAGDLLSERPWGIEFAMPSNILTTIHKVLAAQRSLRSPWLGLAIMSRVELRNELGGEKWAALRKPGVGVFVENCFDPGPAHAAGMRPGDFLTTLDGQQVIDPYTFQRLLYLAGIGTEVELEYWRDGQTYARRVKVEERPEEARTR